MDRTKFLSGKTALVTGAGGGIGAAIAIALAEAGAIVGLIDRDENGTERTKAEIAKNSASAISFIGDISKEDERERLMDSVSKFLGTINVLVNNAADHGQRISFLEVEQSEWDRIISTNLTAGAFFAKKVAPAMIDCGEGCIINIAAIQAQLPVPTYSAYVASKGGVVALTRALAVELSPKGIRVNAIAPGAISTTSMSTALLESNSELQKAPTLLGRMGTAQDVADVAIFLASPKSSFITGSVIVVDGGRSLSREPDPMASFGHRS